MDSSASLIRRRQSSQPHGNHPIVNDSENVLARSPAKNTEAIDRYSLYRSRFWRCLTMASHAAFILFLFQGQEFIDMTGIKAIIFAAIVSVILSVIALFCYYWTARFMCYSHGPAKYKVICYGIMVFIHELTVQRFKKKPFFPFMFSLQTISFISYLRAVVSGDQTGIIHVLSFVYGRTAAYFYFDLQDVSGSVYFALVTMVGSLALAIDKGSTPINVGALDLFLGILGDLEFDKAS